VSKEVLLDEGRVIWTKTKFKLEKIKVSKCVMAVSNNIIILLRFWYTNEWIKKQNT